MKIIKITCLLLIFVWVLAAENHDVQKSNSDFYFLDGSRKTLFEGNIKGGVRVLDQKPVSWFVKFFNVFVGATVENVDHFVDRTGTFLAYADADDRLLPLFLGSTYSSRSFRKTAYRVEDVFGLEWASLAGKKTVKLVDLSKRETVTAIGGVRWLQWNDDNLFVSSEDSLFSISKTAHRTLILKKDGIRNFSISRSSRRIAFFHSDTLSVYSSDQLHFVTEVERRAGHEQLPVGLSWSADERELVYGIGWHLYFYDLANDTLTDLPTEGQVFDADWVSTTRVVFVVGQIPNNMISDRWFKINLFNRSSGVVEELHFRDNHWPVSVNVSGSGNLLLFSEKKRGGSYRVKLLDLGDGSLKELTKGVDPEWKE